MAQAGRPVRAPTCRSRSGLSRTSSCSKDERPRRPTFSLIEVAELQFGYPHAAPGGGALRSGERARSADSRAWRQHEEQPPEWRGASRREDGPGSPAPPAVPRRSGHPRHLDMVVRQVPIGDARTRKRSVRAVTATRSLRREPPAFRSVEVGGVERVSPNTRMGRSHR